MQPSSDPEVPVPVRRVAPLLAFLVVAAGVVLVGSSTAGQAAPVDVPDPAAGVQVQGVGTTTGTPDVLRVTIGVETGAAGVGEALDAASGAARRVLGALHDAGVDDSDVRTANVHVSPQYDGNGTNISGYLAGQDLAVTLHDVSTAGATISAAVGAGGDAARLQGISYAIDDDAALRATAREQAFADARATAEQYARLAGRTLGAVVLVQETVTSSGPVPMAAGDSSAPVEELPIAPGTTDVTVTAEVRWSLA
jgi:uncharacterized protein YggE